MSNTYISFDLSESDASIKPETISKRFIRTILESPAPVSNPDFIDQFSNIVTWLIEFEDDSYFPNREIGLNSLGDPIIAMPWKSNYGYWTDSNVVLKDLSFHFHVKGITNTQFKDLWNLFELKFGKG